MLTLIVIIACRSSLQTGLSRYDNLIWSMSRSREYDGLWGQFNVSMLAELDSRRFLGETTLLVPQTRAWQASLSSSQQQQTNTGLFTTTMERIVGTDESMRWPLRCVVNHTLPRTISFIQPSLVVDAGKFFPQT